MRFAAVPIFSFGSELIQWIQDETGEEKQLEITGGTNSVLLITKELLQVELQESKLTQSLWAELASSTVFT